jgi:dCMP deaminase
MENKFKDYFPPSWDEYFMRQVYLAASKSKDTRTKIGAVLVKDKAVISQGYNGMPIGVLEKKPKETVSSLGPYLLYVCEQYGYTKNSFLEEMTPDIQRRFERPTKYFYMCHAEANSIFLAARNGIKTLGSHIYTQGIPCADCAKAIIQAGIKKITVHKQWPMHEGYKEHAIHSRYMLQEAGIHVTIFDKELGLDGYCDGNIVRV